MRNITKTFLCSLLIVVILLGFCATAFADNEETVSKVVTVEDALDVVDSSEDEVAEGHGEAAAESKTDPVYEIVDLSEEKAAESTEASQSNETTETATRTGMSGPILSLIVAVALIIFGLVIIVFSNLKIKTGKKGK